MISIFLACCCLVSIADKDSQIKNIPPTINKTPIFGILSQSSHSFPGFSFIAASYVKWIESAGAQVVPIPCDLPESRLEQLYDSINGVVLPGGSAIQAPGGCYYDAAKFFIQKALGNPDDYFVIKAMCLGWEILLNVLTDSQIAHGQVVDPEDEMPVTLFPGWKDSRILGSFPEHIINNLITYNATYENHHHGITVEEFNSSLFLSSFFQMLATSNTTKDPPGIPYVAIAEAKEQPIYGTQFHPEKNSYEWHIPQNGIHTLDSVQVSQAFANFVVNEARRNLHYFSNKTEEQNALIYNYQTTFTPTGYYVQLYLFPMKDSAFGSELEEL